MAWAVSTQTFIDPYQDNVTYLVKMNNTSVNTGSYGTLPHSADVGVAWNAYGTQAYLSKPSGGSDIYTSVSKTQAGSYNCGGNHRLHASNYGAFPMHADFTWEAWVYPTSFASDQWIWGRGDAGSATVGSYIKMKSGGNGFQFWYQNNTIIDTSTSSLFSTNTWYHIAVCRSGNNWYAFVNGVQEGSTASNSIATIPGAQNVLGGDGVTNVFFSGYIEQFQFTRNLAKYTANFTPPQTSKISYVSIPTSQAPATDPYFANVALLCHFNGTNGSTTFTDSSSNGLTVTRSGSVSGMGQLSTSFPRFGTAACVLNSGYSTTGCGIQLPASTGVLNFGSGDFTIEFWACRNGNSGKTGYIFSNGSSSLEIRAVTNRYNVLYNGSTLITSTDGDLSDGYYQYIALCRVGTTLYLFHNGILQGTSTSFSSSIDISGALFGRRTTSDTTTTWCGNIDDLRITTGVGRYTSNFIVPRGEHPNS